MLSTAPPMSWQFQRDRRKRRPAVIDHRQAGWADQVAVHQLALLHIGAGTHGVLARIEAWSVATNEFTFDDHEALLAAEVADLDAPEGRPWCFGTHVTPKHI